VNSRPIFALSLVLLAACDGSTTPPDGGRDGGPDPGPDGSLDGGPPDGGNRDGGSPDGGDRDGGTGPTITWTPCDGRIECGTLEVPVDYDDPSAGTLTIALTRHPAFVPEQRIGVLLLNPGGPGAPGVGLPRALAREFVPLMGQVLARFDLIGFDPRGVGMTGPRLECVSAAERQRISEQLLAATSDAEVDTILRTALEACADEESPALLRNLDTVNTARDMDSIRAALGEERISYYGVSYGTWLGGVYATLFPERLRAALLLSAVPATNDVFETERVSRRGMEDALEAFFEWCDTTSTCAFRPATGTTEEAFLALLESARTSPLPAGADTLDASELLHAVLFHLYRAAYSTIATQLEAARAGDATLLERTASAFAIARDLDSIGAILVNDGRLPAGANPDAWRAALAAIRAESPVFGSMLTELEPLQRGRMVWPFGPDEPFPGLGPIPDAPPILVINQDFDPATPTAGARTMVEAFANGSMLLETSDRGHGLLRGPCTMGRAEQYLLSPGPVDTTRCEPLPVDLTVIGTLGVAIPFGREISRVGESLAGNLVTDAMRWRAEADIAVINGGGIRDALPSPDVLAPALRRTEAPFDITVQDTRELFPFGNRLAVIRVTGRQLWALFRDSARDFNGTTGTSQFLQVSGVRLALSTAAPHLVGLTLEDGTPIADDDSTEYTLALPDFVLFGGTGYTGLIGEPPVVGDALDLVLAAYFRSRTGTVTPTLEGRITVP
jgi:pimeloyl-ACP methyl ester carboxylesterase